MALRCRSEGRDLKRDELLAQISKITLRSTTGHFSLASQASLLAFFSSSTFVPSLQYIHYATHSMHCLYLSQKLLERLGKSCAPPRNCSPHCDSLEKTLIDCLFSYLTSNDQSLVDEALSISVSVLNNPTFKDFYDLNKLLEDLLTICRAWMKKSTKTVDAALAQLLFLLKQNSFPNVIPILTLLSRFLRQSLQDEKGMEECLMKIIEIFLVLIKQGVELRPNDISGLLNVWLYLVDHSSFSITDKLVSVFTNLLDRQCKAITPAVCQQLSDVLSRIIRGSSRTSIQARCTELLIQLPFDFSEYSFLFSPCLRLLNQIPNPSSSNLFSRALSVMLQILQHNSEAISIMIHSSILPYVAMILSIDLPANLVLLFTQLIAVMTQAPEADVLFVACDFYRRLSEIQMVAERNKEVALVEAIAETLQLMRANCPLVVLSIQEKPSQLSSTADAQSSEYSDEVNNTGAAKSPESEGKDASIRSKVTEYQISNVPQLTTGTILDFLSRVTKEEMPIQTFTSIFDAWISNKGNSLTPNEIKEISESVIGWIHRSPFEDVNSIHYLTCLDILIRCRIE